MQGGLRSIKGGQKSYGTFHFENLLPKEWISVEVKWALVFFTAVSPAWTTVGHWAKQRNRCHYCQPNIWLHFSSFCACQFFNLEPLFWHFLGSFNKVFSVFFCPAGLKTTHLRMSDWSGHIIDRVLRELYHMASSEWFSLLQCMRLLYSAALTPKFIFLPVYLWSTGRLPEEIQHLKKATLPQDLR